MISSSLHVILKRKKPRLSRCALWSCGDVTGTARQSHELVHSLFTLSLTNDYCKLTRGRGRITFCNLSNGSVMLKQGQVVAEWRPSTTVHVITTASGKVLQQPVDPPDMDIIDPAGLAHRRYQTTRQVTLLLWMHAC
jgi:hypothetical protein